ncbi:MAG: hypothetical protein RLZZ511_2504 [Cyanobacteriota bacterium]|jgi:hypothetical protein
MGDCIGKAAPIEACAQYITRSRLQFCKEADWNRQREMEDVVVTIVSDRCGTGKSGVSVE